MLADLLVVEVSQGVAGPYASLLLAESGADVVKIEPLPGDRSRAFAGPSVNGSSAVFAALNRNKRSLALDVGSADGRQVLRELIATADVLIRDVPGDVDLGESGSDRTVDCVISPFGLEGPLSQAPGEELVVQAMAAIPRLIGDPGQEPFKYGPDVAQTCTGIMAFNGILAALFGRAMTGQGQRVDISMYGTLLHLQGALWSAMTNPDEWYGSHCEAYTKQAEHGYQTKNGNIYFNLYRGDEEQFNMLLIELGLEESIADPRFEMGGREAVGIGRYAYELKGVWEGAFRDKTKEEVAELLSRYDALATPVNDYTMLEAHPQMEALGLIDEVGPSNGAGYRALKAPWTVEGEPGPEAIAAPLLGQHSEEVLAQMLSYPAERIEALERERVVTQHPGIAGGGRRSS